MSSNSLLVYEISGYGSNLVAVIETSDTTPVLSKKLLDFQETIECRFTLKHVRDMIKKYSQMHLTD